jgi:hypothetical protein
LENPKSQGTTTIPKKQIEFQPGFVPLTVPSFENVLPGVEITNCLSLPFIIKVFSGTIIFLTLSTIKL